MPMVTATPVSERDDDEVQHRTYFIGLANTANNSYTYPTTQEMLIVRNRSDTESITLTVNGSSYTIPKGGTRQITASFTTFEITSTSNSQAFDATAIKTVVKSGSSSSGGGVSFEVLENGETVTIDNSVAQPTPTAPSTPSGLSANPQSTQVSLTWSAVSGATGYKVYRNGSLIGSPTSSAYTDTGLTNGTQYSYTVSATNSVGESPQSSAVTATPVAPSLPSVPTGLSATPGNTQVSLTWTSVSGATSYKVYRGGSLVASPTSASHTDTGLTNGTSYAYTVSAVNGAGESSQSTSVNATPTAPAQTGKVNDASLILYQDNPTTKQNIEVADDVYFQNGDQWTAFATIKPVLNTNAATKIFSRVSPNAVNFEFTFDNHFKCTLTGKMTNGTGSANFPAALDPATRTDFTGYYHVVAVRDGTKLWLYVNDTMVNSVNLASDFWIDPSTSALKFGDNTQTNQPVFKNMGYYNRALTTAELTQNYNALK